MTAKTDLPAFRHGPNHHDWRSPSYVSDWISQDLPQDAKRRPMLLRMVGLIPVAAQRPARILDVGGGYGAVTRIVLDALPEATVVLHDLSETMLAEAGRRLAGFAGRVEYRTSDLASPDWAEDLGGPFDAVVSARAIHNVGDGRLIERIYRDIFGLVRPGGCFLNNDFVFPTDVRIARLYQRDPVRPVPAEEARTGDGDLADQLRWLREAGFGAVECIAKDRLTTLLCALR